MGVVNDPSLSVVVPAFNEERRIGTTLEKLLAYLAQQPYLAEVLVVDDGSRDSTRTLVEGLIAARQSQATPRLQLIAAPHRGKGHAVKVGMLAASGARRFLADADLAMPIEQLERFFPALESGGAQIALGSREAPGSRRFNEPRHRHSMGRIFNALIRALAVPGIRDTQCGFKLFTAQAATHLFGQQRLDGFGFDVELLYVARRSGLCAVEIPIDWYHQEESKVRPLRDSVAMLQDVLRVRWNSLRGRYRFTLA